VIELLIGADDRTGALETAGACADAGFGMVEVVARHMSGAGAATRAIVVDLVTRHVDPSVAAERASALEQVPAGRRAHKLDSTLRGNWAPELVARQRASGRPVLVVPAFPAVGRTCVGGVVLDHGRPVSDGAAGRDVRSPVHSSRPAEQLRAAGAAEVTELGASAIETWLASARPVFAICDVASDVVLSEIAAAWSRWPDVLFAGTSASIGAAALAAVPVGVAPSMPPPVSAPVLVVCSSLHQSAREQVSALVAAGAVSGLPGGSVAWALEASRSGRPAVLMPPVPDHERLDEVEAPAMAQALARGAAAIRSALHIGTLVLIGGDIAAEVLGPEPMLVGGTVAPGVPWCRRPGPDSPLVLTRAGGFGGPSALVELLSGVLVP
jgi:4-hydroxythreonine-4-phosphate dehydrogenase